MEFDSTNDLIPDIKTLTAMPINKEALKRYVEIDKMLADPFHDYTTAEIWKQVRRKTSAEVGLRMIQKDLVAIEEEFDKKLVRGLGGRGTVRDEDQSAPLFYQVLTSDEESMLKEVLRTLGRFEGFDNFKWFGLLSRKLNMDKQADSIPIISFEENDVLQLPGNAHSYSDHSFEDRYNGNMIVRLYTAISRRNVIRVRYTPFDAEMDEYIVYPYQLRQYNRRWFLIASPHSESMKNNEGSNCADGHLILTLPLDRMSPEIEIIENIVYVNPPEDFEERFKAIVGVTYLNNVEDELIYFAVSPKSANYVKTKWIHHTQQAADWDELEQSCGTDGMRNDFTHLSGWSLFSIECRPNVELYALLSSYGDNLVVISPASVRDEMVKRAKAAAANYGISVTIAKQHL